MNRLYSLLFLLWVVPPLINGCFEPGNSTAPNYGINQKKRVVALMPSLAELTEKLLSDSQEWKLVGYPTSTSLVARENQELALIGPYHKLNIEKIVSLRPDLVLASRSGNLEDQILQLRHHGMRVEVFDFERIGQVIKSIRLVADLLGEGQVGATLARSVEKGISEIKIRAATRGKKGVSKTRLVIQLGMDPLIVAGGESYLTEICDLVYAENIFSGVREKYPRVSVEQLLAANPDMILIVDFDGSSLNIREITDKWKRFSRLTAVNRHQILPFRSDSLFRPSHKIMDGIEQLERTVHSAP